MKIIPQSSWIWARPERALAFGFGSGLSIKAPGTVGTLYAWAIYLVLQALLDSHVIAWMIRTGNFFDFLIKSNCSWSHKYSMFI